MTGSERQGHFQVLLRVRYGECDAQQVVFNARYADYADVAMTEYLRALFGSHGALLAQGLDCQAVRVLIEWKSPARFDEVLALEVHTAQVGTTSFTLHVDCSEFFGGRHIATMTLTYVLVAAATHTKTPVPAAVREALLAGAPGQVVNQAGIALCG